jgi:ribosomal protein S21
MPVQVTKKEKETSQNLGHRFTKTVRQSGILLQVRKTKFFKRAKSDLVKKRSALKKAQRRIDKVKAEKLAKPK